MIKVVAYIIIGFLYACIGGLVLWKKWFLYELSPKAALSLGILFIVYGIFRIYRAIRSLEYEDED